MWENRMGEIARGSWLVAQLVRDLGIPDPARAIPADLVGRVSRILEDAVGQHRGSVGGNEGKRREVWITYFVTIFRLIASRQLQEQHPDVKSFHRAIRNDLQTTMLLSERGFGIVSGWAISRSWDQRLFEMLLEYSNQYEIEWLERRERLRSALMPDPAETLGDALALCKPRDARAKDTFTARRMEQFRRRMEAGSTREVGMADMVDYLGYMGPSMLQRVIREAKSASEQAKSNVGRMLRCRSPEEFWSVVDARRNPKKA
jgi:hypothetical protein